MPLNPLLLNAFTFDGATKDPMQQAVRDAFMAATAQAQAEATKAAQRAGIEHAKQNDERAYLGRKPSYTRDQLNKVRDVLRQEAASIAQIARETALSRQTIYRIKDDRAVLRLPWLLGIIMRSARSCGRDLGDYNPA
jgi:putative DNA-invertase from lambdoid prophage Rac